MELVLAVVAGSLYACGLYLMLRRRLAQLIIGLSLLANGSNVLIFAAAGVTRGQPPIVEESGNVSAVTKRLWRNGSRYRSRVVLEAARRASVPIPLAASSGGATATSNRCWSM